MATGIQTGMQRGSRSGISRGSALGKGAPGGGGGPLGKVSEIWKGLSKGMRIGILSLVGVLVFGGLGFALHKNSNQYVDLYQTKMSENDVSEVSAALTEMRIDHSVSETNDGILLHPSKKLATQGALAARNLPRHAVVTSMESGMGKTATEQDMARQQMLEGDITLAFRAMEGVNDARVKLAVPKKTYFQDDNKRTTARIMLSLKPGAELNREKIQGMVNMVSYSVPELRPEDVNITDAGSGRDLTALLPKGDDGSLVASGTQFEIQAAEEKRLQKKAQEALDRALPGKTQVSVNLDMDFSKVEKENFTPGGAADDGVVRQSHQIKREQLDRSGSAGGEDAATQLGGGAPNKKEGDYVNEVESANYLVAQNKTKVVDTAVRTRRLTVSVLADNVSEKEMAAIAGFVGPAIGIDETRGDKITVENVAFDRSMNTPVDPGFGMVAPAENTSSGMPTGALAGVAVAGAAMMLAVLGMFLFKQHSVKGDQGNIITTSAGGITSTAITDHFTDKSGKTTAPTTSAGATQVNTTDQLEQLVKERPTKVAEMLKSTWLS